MKDEKLKSLEIQFFPPKSCSEFLYSQQDGVTLYFYLFPTLISAANKNKRTAFLCLFIFKKRNAP